MLIDTINDLIQDKENIKKDLNKYEEQIIELSVRVIELTIENPNLKKYLEKYEGKLIELSVQVTELQDVDKSLSHENNLLNKNLSKMSKCDSKRKCERSRVQFELEKELAKVKADLAASLERNSELDRKLFRVKAKFDKSLKWTTSAKVLTSLISQESNSRRGLGYHSQNITSNS